jgi:hypothetical protein
MYHPPKCSVAGPKLLKRNNVAKGVTTAAFRKLALSLPQAVEAPHFEATSFRVNKKIFATLGEAAGRAVVKLTREQQEMMSAAEPKVFAAVPSWGKHGWTYLHLADADPDIVRSALAASWRNVAPKKLIAETKSSRGR